MIRYLIDERVKEIQDSLEIAIENDYQFIEKICQENCMDPKEMMDYYKDRLERVWKGEDYS